MRSLLSATALAALLALSAPVLAQSGSTSGSGSMGSTQMQGQTPGSPLPMTQPSPGTMRDTQRPSTAAGAMGSTSGSQSGIGQSGTGQSGMGQSGTTMGQSAAPGASGSAPGRMGTTPGQSGTAPGLAGTTPGQSGTQSMTMDESQVRDLLREQGYGDVQSVTRDGDHFRARAMRNGRPADVTIDAYTGTIRNQAARR